MQATGDRMWSGRLPRLLKHIVTPYALGGATLAVTYSFIMWYLRHHQETNNDRPLYFDHTFTLTLIGTGIGFFAGGLPRYAFTGAFITFLLISPMSWWLYKHGRVNSMGRHSNIFYENGVTEEERERI